VEQLEHRWCPSYSLVTSRAALAGTDSVDWGTLGPQWTVVPNPSTVLSTRGVSVTVSKTVADSFRTLVEKGPGYPSGAWIGNFAPGDAVLWTNDAGPNSGRRNPINLNFGGTTVAAGGAQIDLDIATGASTNFTAEVDAYDASRNLLASFTEMGVATTAEDNSAIFIGISSSSANIYQIAVSIKDSKNGEKGDFAINKFDFRTSPLAPTPVAAPRAQSVATPADGGDSLYIGDGSDNTVKQFDAATGAYEGTLITSGSGGLSGPRGLIFGEGHNLLVVNQNVGTTTSGDVLRYDGQTGSFINQVVTDTVPHAPYDPRGMVRGPQHSLFVGDLGDLGNLDGTGRPGRLIQFDEKTGAWIRDLSPTVPFTTDNGPRGVVIGPDGDLYVAVRNFSPLGGEVMRFDPVSGAFLGDFVDSNPTNDLNRPEGLVFGPDGNLYVTSFRTDGSDTDKILEFNGKTGAYLGKIDLDQVAGDRAFAQALLFGPRGKLFVPITGNGPDTGEVRRYDVNTGTFDVFIPPNATGGPLGSPFYLTFGNTDPATLAFSPGPRTSHSASPVAAPTTSQTTSASEFASLASSLLRMGPQTLLAAPLPGPTALPILPVKQSAVRATSEIVPAPHPRAADVVFAGSESAAAETDGWLTASLSLRSFDVL
jgi:hypothetical protein